MTGRWFSPGTQVTSSKKTGRHDIAEILFKVALNTHKPIDQQLSEVNVTVIDNYELFVSGCFHN